MAENDAQGAWTLPNGWVWTILGDVISIRNGFAFRSKDYQSEGVLLIRQSNLGGDGVSLDCAVYLPDEYLHKHSDFAIYRGDILIGMSGSVGKICVYDLDAPALQNQRTGMVRLYGEMDKRYVRYFLNTLRTRLLSQAKGVAVQNISAREIQAFPFPLAPLPEQRRIVAKIETQFTRLDAAVAALERAQANLRRYKAAVLKAACEGRLVPTEAEQAGVGAHRDAPLPYEPADQLLARILSERRARWEAEHPGKRYKEPVTPDTEDLPQLPEGWVWAAMDQLLREPMLNGRSVPDREDGFPVLRLTAIRDGAVSLSQRKAGAWSDDEASRYLVQLGDFFVVRGSGSIKLVGRAGLVKEKPDAVAFPDTLIRVRVEEILCRPGYLVAIWESPLMRSQVETVAHTTAGIYKINQKHIRSFVIPVPPLAEQSRIVTEVERRLSLVAALEASVEAALARAARLRQAVLKQAFEGRLVPQDADDESASVLLERIRAERAQQGRRSDRKPQPQQMELF